CVSTSSPDDNGNKYGLDETTKFQMRRLNHGLK
ncbi:unnamed protein product, partial [Didymodactylos carnosus]